MYDNCIFYLLNGHSRIFHHFVRQHDRLIGSLARWSCQRMQNGATTKTNWTRKKNIAYTYIPVHMLYPCMFKCNVMPMRPHCVRAMEYVFTWARIYVTSCSSCGFLSTVARFFLFARLNKRTGVQGFCARHFFIFWWIFHINYVNISFFLITFK